MNSFCFAYFANNQFVGWHGDTFGSITKVPKIYSDLETMRSRMKESLTSKLRKINTSSYEQEKDKYVGLAALSLFVFNGEDVLRGKNVELRVVECPFYDGPNPHFDKEKWRETLNNYEQMITNEGIRNLQTFAVREAALTQFKKIYPRPKSDSWIYADYQDVEDWASKEPNTFLEIIKPDNDNQDNK